MRLSNSPASITKRGAVIEIVNEPIFQYLSSYAYQPGLVYLAIFVLMYLSSFGLPIPEEVTLLSVGFLAFMGSRPDLFPPQVPDAVPISAVSVAIVCSIAVLSSDMFVYGIGRFFGRKALDVPLMRKFFSADAQERVENFTKRYGLWAVGAFRFMPGLRFPGHLLCGCFRLPFLVFLAVDGFAVIISVPTQVLLIAYYGEEILWFLKTFKVFVLFAVISGLTIYFLRVWLRKRAQKALVQEK